MHTFIYTDATSQQVKDSFEYNTWRHCSIPLFQLQYIANLSEDTRQFLQFLMKNSPVT